MAGELKQDLGYLFQNTGDILKDELANFIKYSTENDTSINPLYGLSYLLDKGYSKIKNYFTSDETPIETTENVTPVKQAYNQKESKDYFSGILSKLDKLGKKDSSKLTNQEQIIGTLLGGITGWLGRGKDWSGLGQVTGALKGRKQELSKEDEKELALGLKKIGVELERAKQMQASDNLVKKFYNQLQLEKYKSDLADRIKIATSKNPKEAQKAYATTPFIVPEIESQLRKQLGM